MYLLQCLLSRELLIKEATKQSLRRVPPALTFFEPFVSILREALPRSDPLVVKPLPHLPRHIVLEPQNDPNNLCLPSSASRHTRGLPESSLSTYSIVDLFRLFYVKNKFYYCSFSSILSKSSKYYCNYRILEHIINWLM